jgi:hypothetical protein
VGEASVLVRHHVDAVRLGHVEVESPLAEGHDDLSAETRRIGATRDGDADVVGE